jgi:hypothetical protein
MVSLSAGNADNKAKLASAGACEAVVAALRKHGVEGSHAGVAEQVSACMRLQGDVSVYGLRIDL